MRKSLKKSCTSLIRVSCLEIFNDESISFVSFTSLKFSAYRTNFRLFSLVSSRSIFPTTVSLAYPSLALHASQRVSVYLSVCLLLKLHRNLTDCLPGAKWNRENMTSAGSVSQLTRQMKESAWLNNDVLEGINEPLTFNTQFACILCHVFTQLAAFMWFGNKFVGRHYTHLKQRNSSSCITLSTRLMKSKREEIWYRWHAAYSTTIPALRCRRNRWSRGGNLRTSSRRRRRNEESRWRKKQK